MIGSHHEHALLPQRGWSKHGENAVLCACVFFSSLFFSGPHGTLMYENEDAAHEMKIER